MTVKIQCTDKVLINETDHSVTISVQNVEIVFYKRSVNITDIGFHMSKSIDNTNPHIIEKTCCIELCTSQGSIEIEYPYELSQMASDSFDCIVNSLKSYIKPSNQT